MIGPHLKTLINEERLNLPNVITNRDFETLYTFLLESMGNNSVEKIKEKDERVALIVLCRFPCPGKKPKFINGIHAYFSNFKGIADNERLQEKFRKKISRRILKIDDPNNLCLSSVHSVFNR